MELVLNGMNGVVAEWNGMELVLNGMEWSWC